MAQASYRQFCPVAMAAEVLCTRWTMILVRELLAGSTRFNDLRRGVPKMSPSLLTRRLRELEGAGIVERKPIRAEKGIFEYQLTEAGTELRPLVEAMGVWGQRWVESQLSLRNLDPSLLMWDMRRNLNPSPLPERRVVIQFLYMDLPTSKRNWWLVVEPNADVDLCRTDPGFEVDLYVSTDLRTMTGIWMGLTTVAKRALQHYPGWKPAAREKNADMAGIELVRYREKEGRVSFMRRSAPSPNVRFQPETTMRH